MTTWYLIQESIQKGQHYFHTGALQAVSSAAQFPPWKKNFVTGNSKGLETASMKCSSFFSTDVLYVFSWGCWLRHCLPSGVLESSREQKAWANNVQGDMILTVFSFLSWQADDGPKEKCTYFLIIHLLRIKLGAGECGTFLLIWSGSPPDFTIMLGMRVRHVVKAPDSLGNNSEKFAVLGNKDMLVVQFVCLSFGVVFMNVCVWCDCECACVYESLCVLRRVYYSCNTIHVSTFQRKLPTAAHFPWLTSHNPWMYVEVA